MKESIDIVSHFLNLLKETKCVLKETCVFNQTGGRVKDKFLMKGHMGEV